MNAKVDYLLNSQDRKEFDKLVASFAESNTPKVSEAYKNTHWPKKIGFKFPEFVKRVIDLYMEYSVLNNVYYTNNQETTFLNDPFFKFIFVKIAGNTNIDLGLRDHIWSLVSACMSIANNNSKYIPFWKPYTYLTTEERKEFINIIENDGGVGSTGMLAIAGVLIAVVALS